MKVYGLKTPEPEGNLWPKNELQGPELSRTINTRHQNYYLGQNLLWMLDRNLVTTRNVQAVQLIIISRGTGAKKKKNVSNLFRDHQDFQTN